MVGEAILGVDGAIEMTEERDGWLKIYSDDPEAFGLRVKATACGHASNLVNTFL